MGLDGTDIYFIQFTDEKFPVFCIYDGLHRSTEYLHAVFFKNPALIKLHTAIEGSLASERKQDSVRTLLCDDFLDKEWRDGQKINLVRASFTRLHGSDIRIDENRAYAFFPHSLKGLRTGIVKFSSLTNFQCSGPEQQHFLYFFKHFADNLIAQASDALVQQIYKFVKQKLRVNRTGSRLRMELG